MADAARPRPIEDVHEISAITYGFMASKALFAAIEFDVFTHIAQGADTRRALAEITGIAENRLLTLLAALKLLGLVTEAGGRLVNAPATSRYLVAGAPGDFRDYVRYVNGAAGYESFRYLDMALRGERVFKDKGWYEGLVYEGGIGGERFSSAQHAGSLGPSRLMAKRVDLKDRRKLLDVGGGSGAYSITFCAANPQLSATILDFPETVDTAKRYAREAGLADRITSLAGNAVAVDWPEGHDVVLMSYVWSAVGEADIAILAKRAVAALPPGGLLLIHDFMVDDAREGPRFAAWYLLGSMLDNPSAVCLTPAYVERVLRDVGFRVEKTEVMLAGITMLTKASKAPP
ncbi:MAG TPA: methyltransferase [Roseiarcus sp.]|nr:methyltransferase [Roseiarcus sp.]